MFWKAEQENSLMQHHTTLRIFFIYKYKVLQNIWVKGLYRYESLFENYVLLRIPIPRGNFPY
jgi:hypothetical protein